jgi:hypothetical protein
MKAWTGPCGQERQRDETGPDQVIALSPLPSIGGGMQHDGVGFKATGLKYESNGHHADYSFHIAAASHDSKKRVAKGNWICEFRPVQDGEAKVAVRLYAERISRMLPRCAAGRIPGCHHGRRFFLKQRTILVEASGFILARSQKSRN